MARFKNTAKRLGFVLLNGWIVFHLSALVLAPASMPPAAPVVQTAWRGVGRYLEALYLNHGYHFFAPDPGGSTIIEYQATMPDGSSKTEKIPNRDIFPRLLYHRHFMLTEHMSGVLDDQPELEDLFAKTYANQIHNQTGATRVRLFEVRHDISSPAEVLAGKRLDDPAKYEQQLLGDFRWDEVAPPAPSSEGEE